MTGRMSISTLPMTNRHVPWNVRNQAVTPDDHTGEHTRRMSPHEVKVRRNYSLLSISNDILIGMWFLVGSFFFFSDQLMCSCR